MDKVNALHKVKSNDCVLLQAHVPHFLFFALTRLPSRPTSVSTSPALLHCLRGLCHVRYYGNFLCYSFLFLLPSPLGRPRAYFRHCTPHPPGLSMQVRLCRICSIHGVQHALISLLYHRSVSDILPVTVSLAPHPSPPFPHVCPLLAVSLPVQVNPLLACFYFPRPHPPVVLLYLLVTPSAKSLSLPATSRGHCTTSMSRPPGSILSPHPVALLPHSPPPSSLLSPFLLGSRCRLPRGKYESWLEYVSALLWQQDNTANCSSPRLLHHQRLAPLLVLLPCFTLFDGGLHQRRVELLCIVVSLAAN